MGNQQCGEPLISHPLPSRYLTWKSGVTRSSEAVESTNLHRRIFAGDGMCFAGEAELMVFVGKGYNRYTWSSMHAAR